MKDETPIRNKILHVRFTPLEWIIVQKKFEQSTCRKVSEFVRKRLLDKPVTIYHRNKSLDDFATEMVLLRRELNAIGINYNQQVKRLNSMNDYTEVKKWFIMHSPTEQLLLKKVEEINAKIAQINDQWLL
ncbi:MAG: plasmid mobilization relaxosome protein MobC [Bacteroidota bacterium]